MPDGSAAMTGVGDDLQPVGNGGNALFQLGSKAARFDDDLGNFIVGNGDEGLCVWVGAGEPCGGV